MTNYDFELIFKLENEDINPEIYIDELYEKIYDDALLGIGRKGYIAFDFSRDSNSVYEAIYSAIEDIESVIPSAQLVSSNLIDIDFQNSADLNVVYLLKKNLNQLNEKLKTELTWQNFIEPLFKEVSSSMREKLDYGKELLKQLTGFTMYNNLSFNELATSDFDQNSDSENLQKEIYELLLDIVTEIDDLKNIEEYQK